jgi:hypothetical protein
MRGVAASFYDKLRVGFQSYSVIHVASDYLFENIGKLLLMLVS